MNFREKKEKRRIKKERERGREMGREEESRERDLIGVQWTTGQAVISEVKRS